MANAINRNLTLCWVAFNQMMAAAWKMKVC